MKTKILIPRFVSAQTETSLNKLFREDTNQGVEVFNLDGKRVSTIFNEVAEKEKQYLIDFNSATLPRGIYFCRFRSDAEVRTRKMIIIH